MFLQGNSVRTQRRDNLCNEDRSPPKSTVVIAGPRCEEQAPPTSIAKVSRRGAGRERCGDLLEISRCSVDDQRLESSDGVRDDLEEWVVGVQASVPP